MRGGWLKERTQYVLRNIHVYVARILFDNEAQQISFNSAEKWPRKRYRNMTFSLMEKNAF